ncbi:MAG: hypothetical protein J0I84_07555 [Terrimonas sp.]|nr:hypothetical protein [Terrimonas sp.]OJY89970.1 MAG: hypothetical protein BGP13_19950 [Sphingobacteriales bacterium 40-81]
MRTKKIKIIIVVLLVVVSLFTTAGVSKWLNGNRTHVPPEDGKIVFKKLYAKLVDFNADLNVSGSITLYEGETVKEETSFELLRQRHKVFHRFDYIKQIGNEKIAIQLDTVNKYLWISKPDKEMLKKQRKGILPFSDLMADTSFFSVTSLPGDKPSIAIINNYQPEIKSCVLIYDQQHYTIQQAIIEWWKEPGSPGNRQYFKTVTDYQYNAATAINIDELLESIVKIDKKNVEVNSAYTNYKVELTENFKN